MHHCLALLPRILLVFAFAVLVNSNLVIAAENAEPPAPGFHLIAKDDCGVSGKQPHLQIGKDYHFREHHVSTDKVDADHPARTIAYDGTAITFNYRGMNPQAKYKIRAAFLSDHPDGPRFPTRVVRLKADETVLGGEITLPEDEVLVRTLDVPAEVYADGAMALRVERVAGHNAVVSSVEIWSDRDEGLADVSVAKIFADHMVLQRDQEIPIWGWAKPGQQVTVKLGSNEVRTTTDPGGRWRAKLPAMTAGGPHQMTISGKNSFTLGDILVGDVWVCSGQSNMEMMFKQDRFYPKEKAQANHPEVRLFKVPWLWSAGPAERLSGEWQECQGEAAADFSGVGYYFGRELHKELGVPIGLISAAVGGSPIDNWTPGPTGHWYNGMLHPLVPYGIRGAIWYQGEANVGAGMHYLDAMKGLITGWRKAWKKEDLPFYFVQLAPYRYGDDATKLPAMWEAQTASMAIPNTGMAATTDVGNVSDIHPTDKRTVGHRLALWALAKTYGREGLVYSGPIYDRHVIDGDRVVIHFEHVGDGLASMNDAPLDWFEIAGEDRNFVPAKAVIEGKTVAVSSESVRQPVAVRFGWSQLAQPNLANKEGLPALPFRTDKW